MTGRWFRWMLAAAAVALTVGAQPAKRAAAKAAKADGALKEGVYVEGPTLIYVRMLASNLDTDKDLTIDEGELQEGAVTMLGRAEDCHGKLLKLFDEDADGKLSEAESRAVRGFLFGLLAALPQDRDGNWELDNAESDSLWEDVTRQCFDHNAAMRKFDADGDGKLDPREAAEARNAGGDKPKGK